MATKTHLFKELNFFPITPTIVRTITKKEFNGLKRAAKKASSSPEEYETKLNEILIRLRDTFSKDVPGVIDRAENNRKDPMSLDSLSQDDFLDTRDWGVDIGKELNKEFPDKLSQMIVITYILNYLKITPEDFRKVDWNHPHLELPLDLHSDEYNSDDDSDEE
jgi:hypothetical protein